MVSPLVTGAVPGLIQAGSSLLGKVLGGKDDAAHDAKDMAKYVGKHAIQWRVEDANAAGVHPLYALGASVMNSAPVAVGADNSWVDEMGQGIARAADATLSKVGGVDAQIQRLALERAGLENELLRSQIAVQRANVAPRVLTNPGMPGQGDFVMGDNNKFRVNRQATPAQDWENQYGEPGEWIGGGFNMVSDLIRNLKAYEESTVNPWLSRTFLTPDAGIWRNWW